MSKFKTNTLTNSNYLEVLKQRKIQPVVENFELGTLEIKCLVKDREHKLSLDFIQDNIPELFGRLPDGEYSWIISLKRETATKTIYCGKFLFNQSVRIHESVTENQFGEPALIQSFDEESQNYTVKLQDGLKVLVKEDQIEIK